MSTLLTSFTFWTLTVAIVVIAAVCWGWWRSWSALRRLTNSYQKLHEDLLQGKNQLTQARRMEAVGILAGSIVHNLNNLLAVILGHTRMAMHELPQKSSSQEELERVVKAGHMASDLVNEISDFYRQADQARKPTNLVPVIHDTLKMLRDILPSSVQIHENLATKSGPVMASATGVQQILMNLCSNAVQAIDSDGGLIEVSLQEEKVDSWHRAVPQDLGPGTYAKLTVRDNGRGMAPEVLERIFESYFTETGDAHQMGIGLSTVKRILDDHDSVSIPQSVEGQGTRFDIYFPMIAWGVPQPAIPEAESTRRQPGQIFSLENGQRLNGHGVAESNLSVAAEAETAAPRATVLLVDDEEMVAQVVTKGLRRLGFRVIMHTDSRKALADFVETPDIFDIVITDQIMPHMSGVMLTRKIHDLREDIPVILITGFRDSFNEQQAREAGVQDFVIKPTSHRDLADFIDRALLRRMKGRG